MSYFAPLRDVFLVAWFEVLRALRTWRAIALFTLYGLATAGAAYVFTLTLWAIEQGVAEQFGLAKTKKPGAMMETLMEQESLRTMLQGMVGDPELLDQVLAVPVLAIFNLWFGTVLLPYFAATTSAESLSIDIGSRALRFEALRTGRLELVAGRYVGQLFLTGSATMISVVGVWLVGMFAMVGNEPLELFNWLCWLSLRAWFFSMPFVGIGIACSQMTGWPMVARVLALATTTGTWFGTMLMRYLQDGDYAVIADIGLQILPQGWMTQMWEPTGWMVPAVVYAFLGPAFALVCYPLFARRDL